jgi:anti-sigma regulatory factor (Ser/Thr protein kinase)
MSDPSDRLSLQLRSDPSKIAEARKALEAFATRHGLEAEDVEAIGLVVNEAIANVIRHAYKNRPDGRIELRAEMVDGELVVLLRDWGSGELPNLAKPKTDLYQPGGLGLPCMKQMTDSLEFIPQSDGMLLRMTKRKR